ncbi:uncharacterized protein LOC133327215 [Musca vetustissima]|uniref:uncharacterized protein LOC133327215 n=1 Tax=Musca vetustissima TaxID=27455 RepID=UPI002AB6A039|nr:uncharacterized protein LOC133327215 [Musca vetustissima]
MSCRVEFDLPVEVDVLTTGTVAEVVNAVLESLLYQRNQIPFVYKTYRYYVNKWTDDEEKHKDMEAMDSVTNFQVQRQRNLAKSTKDSICAMRETIAETFERTAIKSIRFLFGGTSFTPKESYTIHIPTKNVSTSHAWQQHRMGAHKLNETLISLLTNESLYSIFSQQLSPTNVYLEFELFDLPMTLSNTTTYTKSNIFPREFSTTPSSCKDIQIHLVHKRKSDTGNQILKCCKDMQIFEDDSSPYLENNVTSLANCKNNMRANDMENTGWWESEIIVRGFKEQSIKGFSMWN